MSEPGKLGVQEKWEDLAEYLYGCVLRDMPKSERFTLGADIRANVWSTHAALVRLSLRAGSRASLLDQVDVQAKSLMAMVRLGIRIGAIPSKRQEPVARMLQEIGRMIGGLKKVR
ncbi:MAG: four helix bundle protein [Desulfovibrio sp.]|nr:four helix bundle protein [Desulfovibrio sp.]